jgi:hypothetical protein
LASVQVLRLECRTGTSTPAEIRSWEAFESQHLANHESSRTTVLYGQPADEIKVMK